MRLCDSGAFQLVNVTCVRGDCGLPARMYFGLQDGRVCHGHAMGLVAPHCAGADNCACDAPPTAAAVSAAVYFGTAAQNCHSVVGQGAAPARPAAMAVWGLSRAAHAARALCPSGPRTPARSRCPGHVAPGPGAGPLVCARLQYVMCAGQRGGLSTVCCRPATQVFAVSGLPDGLEGYRLFRVDPGDPERGCLKAYGGVRWPWAWDGSVPDWRDPEADFARSCPDAETQLSHGLPNALWYQPPALLRGQIYFASLRVTNEAGLSAIKTSDGVVWTETPLEGGEVDDGALVAQDLQWQGANDALSASWMEFYSFYGPARYEVCAGTRPDACDVAGPANVTRPVNATGAAAGVTGEVPYPRRLYLEPYRHRFEGLALAHGVRYYVTVTLVDTIGQRVRAASDGVAVDATAAAVGIVVDGRRSDFEDRDFEYSTKFFFWWHGFADAESGVTRYEVALSASADPWALGAGDWQEVYGVTMATLTTAAPVPDGTILYAHVKAVNGAGLAAFGVSNGRIMDRRPPVKGLVVDGDDAALAEYQGSSAATHWDLQYQRALDTLVARWRGFVTRAGPDDGALPERFRPRPPRIEVGLSTTKATPPNGYPDVVSWLPCDPSANASNWSWVANATQGPCTAAAEGALPALLRECANVTAQLLQLQAPNCANSTCAEAVAEYLRTCNYQSLTNTDLNKTLVDELAAACGPRPPPCDAWGASGTLAVPGLDLRAGQPYYVHVRATAASGLDIVVPSDGVVPDPTPLERGWIATPTEAAADGSLTVRVAWGAWADLAVHHYEVCVAPHDSPCADYRAELRYAQGRRVDLPPSDGLRYHQVCVRALDYVQQRSTKCQYVVQTTAAPPVRGWVQNRIPEHRAHVEWLGECHWGGFTALPDAGGVRSYEWGIGRSPEGTEVLPFRAAPYARAGAVAPLRADPAAPYYCTVRAVTPAGVSVTASSPAFWVCPAVVKAGVAAHYSPGAAGAGPGPFCVTWHVPPEDPGAACVARVEWAVGHQPRGASVRAFAEAAGPGACAPVPLVDGSAYYATVRLVARSGAVGAFVSDAVLVDTSPPVIHRLRLGAWSGGTFTELHHVAAPATLTATWTVREAHTRTLRTTLTLWAGDAVAAEVTVPEPWQGQYTFAVPLQSGTAYRCDLHAQGFLRRSEITVVSARYGGNCDTADRAGADVTHVARQCDGQTSCLWTIDAGDLGPDPFPQCFKDMAIAFKCGAGGCLRRVTVAAEASGQTAHLGCAGFGFSDACALKYCNAWVDLRARFCGGAACYTAAAAQACLRHYLAEGRGEGRTPDPTKLCAEAGSQPSVAEWQCLPGIGVPVRLNAKGDPECNSADGTGCHWGTGDCLATLASPRPSSLACGAQHDLAVGGTGYAQATHWCARARQLLTGWTEYATTQCYASAAEVAAHHAQFPEDGDRQDNPLFGGGGDWGPMTLAACKQRCVDTPGCVAVEWHTPAPEGAAACAGAWACSDVSRSWGGGTVYRREKVTGDNPARLHASRTSNTVTADASAPDLPDLVRDGLDRREDADWQTSARGLSATWTVATDPESGLAPPQVCFGTAPGACDTSGGFRPALLPHMTTWRPAAPLGAGPYYATVRQYNGAGLHRDRGSDGIRVDVARPVFGAGARVRLADAAGATARRALAVEWDAASDAGSGLAEYRVAVGLRDGASGLVEYFVVGLATQATLTLPPHAPAYRFYVTVQARDVAGLSTFLSSGPLSYDTTLLKLTEIRLSLTPAAGDAFARHARPRVPAHDFYVFLNGAADAETGIAQVRWWLSGLASLTPVTPPAVVADWRRGWRVQALGVATGEYRLAVELRNGAGGTAHFEAPVHVVSAGPTVGQIWDGLGAADLAYVPMGQPVAATWRGVADPGAMITGLEWRLAEKLPGGAPQLVVPW